MEDYTSLCKPFQVCLRLAYKFKLSREEEKGKDDTNTKSYHSLISIQNQANSSNWTAYKARKYNDEMKFMMYWGL